MDEFLQPGWMTAFLKVVLIDLVLSGDNAIVIGLAAAGLPPAMRDRAIMLGIGAATLLRVSFAAITTQLLAIVGLLFAGGLLLLWVCWRMWRELRITAHQETQAREALSNTDIDHDGTIAGAAPRKTFTQAAIQIIIADVSMSLDNVLAVAGAAREHIWVLVFGLVLSIALMGVAASYIAKLLHRHRWISYVGLLVILYVAVEMCYRGVLELWPYAFG